MKEKGISEEKLQFIEMRAQGLSFMEISEKIGVSKQTLIEWSKALSVELKNARALRLDELFQRFAIAKEKRLELLARELGRIQSELSERDLSDVATEKLFEMMLKCNQHIKDEFQPIEFSNERSFSDPLDMTTVEKWEA
jgi:transcriptional regulator with XRE-family HTH domain